MRKLLPLILLLTLAISCSENKTEENNDKPNEKIQQGDSVLVLEKSENDVFLEGVYGTSTRLPFFEYNAGNCFDGKIETGWLTMNGAGPNEGVMCYFNNPVFVKEIQVLPFKRDALAKIKTISVYCNGKAIGDFSMSQKISVNLELSSLFVKVKDVEKVTRVEREVEEPDYEEEWIEVFDENFGVGISEIQIYDQTGLKQFKAPLMLKGSVSSSSVLSPEAAYHSSNLFDSKKDLVWAEGSEGKGVGEQIFFTFKENVKIEGLAISNGYQRSETHYKSNARLKSFEFSHVGDTSKKELITISDFVATQNVVFNEAYTGREFVLTVKEVFPGEKYNDLVISELKFFSGQVPFIICSGFTEDNILENCKKTDNTVLEKLLNKNIRNYYREEFNSSFSYDRSFLLRSDNTFVMYNNEYDDGVSIKDTLKIVADGNWEIIEANEKTAKIRVFGKYASLTDDYGMYKGQGVKTFQKIFQDYITISEKSLKGEQFVEEIKFGF